MDNGEGCGLEGRHGHACAMTGMFLRLSDAEQPVDQENQDDQSSYIRLVGTPLTVLGFLR